VGESVFALGYPKALSTLSLGTEIKFTRGDISALSGAGGDPTTYTLSLSIQPGNSGGPLFDLNGNLIGITNAKIISPDVDNVSYAIKSVYLKNFIDLSPYKVNLPTGSSLAGKPITDQIEVLSNYISLIKIR
jgi:S1-C subfamily serine protease